MKTTRSELGADEASVALPPFARIIVTFYVTVGILCAGLILSMTALHRGWVKVASYEANSSSASAPQIQLNGFQFR